MTDIPNWDNMPESYRASIIDWESVYLALYNRFGESPTKNQVIEVLQRIQEKVYENLMEHSEEVIRDVLDVYSECIPKAIPDN